MLNPTIRVLVSVAVLLGAVGAALGQDVEYEKYKLDNGMTVILHEDKSLPVAAINFWYRVGAKDESIGRSGFAHLFEHLMFMGTERVPGSGFDNIMESGGGSNNASTGADRTNYYSSGPKELLPMLLWLDADRLEDLARMMDQEKLDKQRDIVRNERRQSYENRPYGKAELKLRDMMYPPEHPYHFPVIGSHEDLSAATVSDVKDFFATFYTPNNVSLCVAGDFDRAEVKKRIAELFGTLPRRLDPPRRSATPVKLDGVKRATTVDKVQLPLVAMAYHSPRYYGDGDAEMDLVAAVLSEGKSSRLYKRLVYDDKIATDVSAYQSSGQLGSMFRINVFASPGADLDRIERTIDEELARMVAEGPTAAELEQRKATLELSTLSRLQSIEAKADRLNAYDFYLGEPNSFKWDLDRYRNATPDGVRRWAERVLTPDARVIIRVLPESPQREASSRDDRPTPSAAGSFAPRSPESFKLANGIPVMQWQKSELPLVSMRLLSRTELSNGTGGRAGAGYLAADMLDEGAGELNAIQFGDAMQSLGARLNTWADHESINVSLRALGRTFEQAVAMTADAVRRPSFSVDEWERVKRLHLENLKRQEDRPTSVASWVASRLFFGDEHPYGRPVAGTPDTINSLTLDEVKDEYVARLRPELTTILIAGDLSATKAKDILEQAFGDWTVPPAAQSTGHDLSLPVRDKLQVVLVDRPDAVQTVIRFIMPGPRYTDEKRVQYRLFNTLFGGSFTSRLNMNLREEHGYTYGAGSGFVMRRELGYVVASSSVQAEVTGAAVTEFLHEIKRIRTGDISKEEAAKARETLRTDVIQSFAGLRGVLSEAAERVSGGLSFGSLTDDLGAMQTATVLQLNELALPALPLEKGVLVLVGDKKTILAEIETILPIPIEVSIRGERM